jgi:hypothetical protein
MFNEKENYAEKTCLGATLSKTNPAWLLLGSNSWVFMWCYSLTSYALTWSADGRRFQSYCGQHFVLLAKANWKSLLLLIIIIRLLLLLLLQLLGWTFRYYYYYYYSQCRGSLYSQIKNLILKVYWNEEILGVPKWLELFQVTVTALEMHAEVCFPHGMKQQVFKFWSYAQSRNPTLLSFSRSVTLQRGNGDSGAESVLCATVCKSWISCFCSAGLSATISEWSLVFQQH